MSSKFGHLQELEVSKEKTAELELPEIKSSPVLILKHAGEANKRYFNKLLKRSQRAQRRIRNRNLNVDVVQETRNQDRHLYAEEVVTGWRNVIDMEGNPVEFSQENVLEFLQALPDWLFDDVRLFAANPENFTEVSPDEEMEEN